MSELIQLNRAELQAGNTYSARVVAAGLIGGLVGTIAMDIFGVGLLLTVGGPASLSFTIIGDAAAAFLSRFGIDVAGGAPLGAVIHYLIGFALGVGWSAVVLRVGSLHITSRKKVVGLAILFVELMSVPMLVTGVLALHMSAFEAAQWFGISFVMHLLYSLILGSIVSYSVRRMNWAKNRDADK